MDYSRIDVLETGTIWQGGTVDAAIGQPPFAGPLLVVCMDRGEDNDQFIDHATVEAVLTVWIDDTPDGGLKDSVLRGLARTVAAWLEAGGNVYVHCAAGVSRASYMDIAVHCEALMIPAGEALARIRAQRPVASPNPGFLAQLQRLYPLCPGLTAAAALNSTRSGTASGGWPCCAPTATCATSAGTAAPGRQTTWSPARSVPTWSSPSATAGPRTAARETRARPAVRRPAGPSTATSCAAWAASGGPGGSSRSASRSTRLQVTRKLRLIRKTGAATG